MPFKTGNKINLGKPCSEKTKEKISEANRGKPGWNRGKHLSDEHREHISDAAKGKHKDWLGKSHTEESKEKMRQMAKTRLKNNPNCLYKLRDKEIQAKAAQALVGHNVSLETRRKISDSLKGERHFNWRGGSSFKPYCPKFDEKLKEEIRDAFGRNCFLCGTHENGKHHHVHHVDYNKGQGCGQKWSLIPLCASCHAKTGYNRHYYFNLLNGFWIDKYVVKEIENV